MGIGRELSLDRSKFFNATPLPAKYPDEFLATRFSKEELG